MLQYGDEPHAIEPALPWWVCCWHSAAGQPDYLGSGVCGDESDLSDSHGGSDAVGAAVETLKANILRRIRR